MKKVLLFLTMIVISLVSFAQSDSMQLKKDPYNRTDIKGKDDVYVIMQDEQMMLMKGSESTPLKSVLTLDDGSVVHPDGVIIRKDGLTTKLNEGDYVYMTGKIMIGGKKEMKSNENDSLNND
jgi:hypothetical protein